MNKKALYKNYYNKESTIFEIVKCLRGRETSFLSFDDSPSFRGIKSHNIAYLKSNFNAFNFLDRFYNMYYSLANLNNMPMMSYSPSKRREQMIYFNKQFKDYFIGYDLGLDFDGKDDFKLCYEEVKAFKGILDDENVPYSLKFSGSGFHIVIESKFLDGVSKSPRDRVKFAGLFANTLCKSLGLKTMDVSIYDTRRIWKVPYTIDVKTFRIALPLGDAQFDNFDMDMVDLDKNIDKDFRDRGILTREGDANNFKSFCDKWVY